MYKEFESSIAIGDSIEMSVPLMGRKISRRDLLVSIGTSAIATALAACIGVEESSTNKNSAINEKNPKIIEADEANRNFTGSEWVISHEDFAYLSSLEVDMFNLINRERRYIGLDLQPLEPDKILAYIADLKSQDMATRQYFSHATPEGRPTFELFDIYNYHYTWAGENLARNNYPDDDTLNIAIYDLMASKVHRDLILSDRPNRLGVGLAKDSLNYYKYITMIFAKHG